MIIQAGRDAFSFYGTKTSIVNRWTDHESSRLFRRVINYKPSCVLSSDIPTPLGSVPSENVSDNSVVVDTAGCFIHSSSVLLWFLHMRDVADWIIVISAAQLLARRWQLRQQSVHVHRWRNTHRPGTERRTHLELRSVTFKSVCTHAHHTLDGAPKCALWVEHWPARSFASSGWWRLNGSLCLWRTMESFYFMDSHSTWSLLIRVGLRLLLLLLRRQYSKSYWDKF